VSPLWRDEITIFLAQRKLTLVRRGRGLRPRIVAATELAVPAGAFGDLDPVLARLADVLAEPTWHGAAARVVVADQPWARYGIVPWPATRLDPAARLTHARCVLADSYGEAVADWCVTLADTPPGQSYVACAMPAGLRTALEDALAPARLALVSLQPQLVVAFNAWRHRLSGDDTWFVSVDDESLSAVHLSHGAWDRVHMARLSKDWGVELERLLAFGRLTRAAGGVGRMFVDAPAWMRGGVAASAGVEWVEERQDEGGLARERALLKRSHI
jgi:hypothetical protein